MGEFSRFIIAIVLPSITLYSWNMLMWFYYPSEELIHFDFTLFATIFMFVIFYALSVFISQYRIVKKRETVVKQLKAVRKVKTVKKRR